MSRPDSGSLRHEKVTATIALTLLLVLASYHLWDARAALTNFEGWWGYFQPMYPGDDYVAVTELAERQDDWHDRYRAITLGMAIRRAAPDADALVTPTELRELWANSPDTIPTWDAPGIKEDYFATVTARYEDVRSDYDPRLDDATIAEWRSRGLVTDLAWNVAYVTDPQEPHPESIVAHTDAERSVIYVVPANLSPVGGESP